MCFIFCALECMISLQNSYGCFALWVHKSQNNHRIVSVRVRWREEPWLGVNDQRIFRAWFIPVGWHSQALNSPDSGMENGERHLDCLGLQELGWPRELACGRKQKNHAAGEWTSLKQRHTPDPHGPCGEMAELCTAGHILWMGEFRKPNSIKMQHCFILLKALDNLNFGLEDRLSLMKFQQTPLNCWECLGQWARGSWWALGRLTWPWEVSKLRPAHNCSAQSSCSERKK